MVYSNTDYSLCDFRSVAYFHFFEVLNASEVLFFFQGFILQPITDTDNMQGHVAQIFKVETLFHNAFNV